MSKRLFVYPLFTLLLLFTIACSETGVPCGDNFCNSNEVCEADQCVLGLFIEGGEEDAGCDSDKNCEEDMVCSDPNSNPPSTCIMALTCDRDSDCQSGLKCGKNGFCR